MITFDQMVAEVTLRLGNRQDISLRIGRWVNYAFMEIVLSPRFSFHELDKVATFNTVANQASYSLTTLVATDRWFLQNVRDNSNNRRIRQVHWQVIDDIEQTTGQPTRYYIYSGNLVLDPIPDTIYNIQLRYRIRPADVVSGGPATQFVGLGTEWEEPLILLSQIKGYEALEQQEKAAAARTLLEGLLGLRQDVPQLEDEDSDFGLVPSLVFRQTP